MLSAFVANRPTNQDDTKHRFFNSSLCFLKMVYTGNAEAGILDRQR